MTECEIVYDAVLKGKKAIIVEMQDDILNVPHLYAANSNMLREIIRYYHIPQTVNQKDSHIHVIGDAFKVGNLMDVIWKAYDETNAL